MKKIEQMYAFISEDKESEGICYFNSNLGIMPMIGADMDRVKELKTIAQVISISFGKKIRIVKFTVREEIGIIEPKTGNNGKGG